MPPALQRFYDLHVTPARERHGLSDVDATSGTVRMLMESVGNADVGRTMGSNLSQLHAMWHCMRDYDANHKRRFTTSSRKPARAARRRAGGRVSPMASLRWRIPTSPVKERATPQGRATSPTSRASSSVFSSRRRTNSSRRVPRVGFGAVLHFAQHYGIVPKQCFISELLDLFATVVLLRADANLTEPAVDFEQFQWLFIALAVKCCDNQEAVWQSTVEKVERAHGSSSTVAMTLAPATGFSHPRMGKLQRPPPAEDVGARVRHLMQFVNVADAMRRRNSGGVSTSGKAASSAAGGRGSGGSAGGGGFALSSSREVAPWDRVKPFVLQ